MRVSSAEIALKQDKEIRGHYFSQRVDLLNSLENEVSRTEKKEDDSAQNLSKINEVITNHFIKNAQNNGMGSDKSVFINGNIQTTHNGVDILKLEKIYKKLCGGLSPDTEFLYGGKGQADIKAINPSD